MLVLSRKNNEAIMIGDNIKIIIVESHHNRVKLGIEAPPEISVHRQEVYNAIQKERKEDSQNKQQ